jgi:hypothetical protein
VEELMPKCAKPFGGELRPRERRPLNNSIVEQLVEKTIERLSFQEVALRANEGKLTPEQWKSTERLRKELKWSMIATRWWKTLA